MTEDQRLIEIATSVAVINERTKNMEDRIQKQIDFEERSDRRQNVLEQHSAVHTQILKDLVKRFESLENERIECRCQCDSKIEKVEKVVFDNSRSIDRMQTFVKWSAGILTVTIPAILGIQGLITSSKSDAAKDSVPAFQPLQNPVPLAPVPQQTPDSQP